MCMGLFSKKKRVTVALRTFNLLKAQPDLTKDLILGAVLQKTPIAQALTKEAMYGYQSKVNRYYSYGAKYYTEGLPRAVYTNFNLQNESVNKVINAYLGGNEARVIYTYSIEYPNAYLFGLQYLVDAYSYDLANDVIPNTTVKLSRAEFLSDRKTIRMFFDNWIGTPYLDRDLGTTYVEGEYILYVELQDFKLSSGKRTIFTYRLNTLLIPELLPTTIPSTPFFPITVLRRNKVNVNSNKASQRYLTTVKLLNKIGMNLDEVIEGLMSTTDGNNPNNLDDCFMTYSVNLNTQLPESKGYLAEYFMSVQNEGLNKTEFEAYLANPYGMVPYTGVQLFESDFNVSLSWNYVDVVMVVGQLPNLKPYQAVFEMQALGEGLTTKGGDYNRSNLIIKYQKTKDTYCIITVNGFEHGVNVYEDRYIVNSIDTYINNSDAKDALFIPINREVLKVFPPMIQSKICVDGLNMVVHAVQIDYLKWYQRGKLLQIIGLVITIVVAIIYPPAWSATATMVQIITAVATQILIQILVAKIIIKGAEIIGDMVGGEIAQIVAAVAAITAVIVAPSNIPIATDLLNAATGLSNSTMKDLTKKLNELVKNKEEFLVFADNKQKEIDAAASTLVTEETLEVIRDSLGLIKGFESVEDYFNRTYYNTDTTELTFAMVNHRIDSLLQLPKAGV